MWQRRRWNTLDHERGLKKICYRELPENLVGITDFLSELSYEIVKIKFNKNFSKFLKSNNLVQSQSIPCLIQKPKFNELETNELIPKQKK